MYSISYRYTALEAATDKTSGLFSILIGSSIFPQIFWILIGSPNLPQRHAARVSFPRGSNEHPGLYHCHRRTAVHQRSQVPPEVVSWQPISFSKRCTRSTGRVKREFCPTSKLILTAPPGALATSIGMDVYFVPLALLKDVRLFTCV